MNRRQPAPSRGATTGDSPRALVRKLGIKAGALIAILGAPRGYRATLGPLPPGTRRRAPGRPADFIHCFVRRRADLERRFASLVQVLAPAGALWISWPKRSSGRVSDLSDGAVRAVGLAHGLVDVKVCAVDRTWSALKFVRRLADR